MKPRLAYVSPLPPENTGIAGYGADLLPALAAHYQLTVIVEQPRIADAWIEANCPCHDAAWLRANHERFAAVLYHFGNSAFHAWMFDLLADVPGAAVLHDFYLGGLLRALPAGRLPEALYHSHGYAALAQSQKLDTSQLGDRFPASRHVIERATGIIVHSPSTFALARRWFGANATAHWQRIPLTRTAVEPIAREDARQALGISPSAYLVCSFGLLGTPKRNLDLLEAWLGSGLAEDPRAHLVFVGEPTEPDYQQRMEQLIQAHGLGERVRITGWAAPHTYRLYLDAADLAVQLRGRSRGETSAAVLDCLNHRLPTIVNAHGSMADLPRDAVHHVPDEFTAEQLAHALRHFHDSPQASTELGKRGWELIEAEHRPSHCAALYRQALRAIERQPTRAQGRPRLLLDISETRRCGRHTGIERAARALTLALCEIAPAELQVAPVYLSQEGGRWHYRHAHAFAAALFGSEHEVAEPAAGQRRGDRLVLLDLCGDTLMAAEQGLYDALRGQGTGCLALVHDLLPLSRPEFFPADTARFFRRWIELVLRLDGAICVSATVVEHLRAVRHSMGHTAPYLISHGAHGADLEAAAPSHGPLENADALFDWLDGGRCILMVGTLEPRKGHLQALEAFSRLWQAGVEVNLLIVGAEGWRGVAPQQRQAIAELVRALDSHPQRGQRLRWLENASDEYLVRIYGHVSGLLAASWDEGFGLPLIEAAHYGVPILARDIAVFREVTGGHARLFEAATAPELARAVQRWMDSGFHPPSTGLPRLTWRQSAANLLRATGAGEGAPGQDAGAKAYAPGETPRIIVDFTDSCSTVVDDGP